MQSDHHTRYQISSILFVMMNILLLDTAKLINGRITTGSFIHLMNADEKKYQHYLVINYTLHDSFLVIVEHGAHW